MSAANPETRAALDEKRIKDEPIVRCPHCRIYGIRGYWMGRHMERCRLGLPIGWGMPRKEQTP